MDKKLDPIKELTAMLAEDKKNIKKKPLLEGYLSEDDFEPQMEDETDEFPMGGGEGDAIAQEKGILPIKKEIDQIRKIALNTIAKLADNPTSESYQFMKKIWTMADKAIESAMNGGEETKSNTSM